MLMLVTNSVIHGGESIVLCEKTLTQRLTEEGFENFIKKTEIIKRLVNKKLTIMSIASAIHFNCADYLNNEFHSQDLKNSFNMLKPKLIEILFEGHPEEYNDYLTWLNAGLIK